jgi:hypothetical protein
MIAPLLNVPEGISTVPPEGQALIAAWIADVFSVLPSPFAEYGEAVTLMTVDDAGVDTLIVLLFDDSTPLVSFDRT